MQKNSNLDSTIVNSVTLGNILGITDRRVRSLVDERVIETVGRGKYEMIKSVQKYCTYLRQKSEVDNNKKGAKLDYETEHALHEKIKREKAELQFKVMKGELHRSQDVEKVMTDMITKAKIKLLSLSSKIAPQIIGIEDSIKAENIIHGLIEGALYELADYKPELFENDLMLQSDSDEDGS